MDVTWNPLTGCTKISPGCRNCFAERIALRLQRLGAAKYHAGFQVTLHDDVLEHPLNWRKPRFIFVNSMADLFHKDVPLEYILRVFDIIRRTPWHTYLVLTKRADRLAELSPELPWHPNLWMGVTVENADYKWRIDCLRRTGAHDKLLSMEPLLGPVPEMDLRGIDWVLVGGETGPNCRPMRPEWVRDIRDQCVRAGVPFHFHGWGGPREHVGYRLLDGESWRQKPESIRKMARPKQLALFEG